MSAGEIPGRSTARAHLSQLIEMFGTDGCLWINTTPESGADGWARSVAPDSGESEDDEQI
ncbi:hypothetical protein [Streptomyces sp. TS71-3]|uniref:hypothetical protein n=1 Tax=Streptomyces sp. TS71-3 TaxID=2733862 RepID=UPI001B246E96|nr:hypothetical protein [Streptomyces sp. TS71-3]GHJ42043.1 hypothetical protein Sm713_76520 [Streptomyces sp. TS71-3]